MFAFEHTLNIFLAIRIKFALIVDAKHFDGLGPGHKSTLDSESTTGYLLFHCKLKPIRIGSSAFLVKVAEDFLASYRVNLSTTITNYNSSGGSSSISG